MRDLPNVTADGVRCYRVSDIMSRDPYTLSPDDDLTTAENMMRIAHVRHMLVTNAERALVGIVSLVDLMRAAETQHRAGDSPPVGEIMSTTLTLVAPNTMAVDAARRMLHSKLGCLPVVDGDGRLVGVLTETDFLRLTARWLAGRC